MNEDRVARQQALDVRQSFIVQAPAGSGKTSLLVQRYLALLAQVEQEPEEIIAITFTRKAAAEMRSRILQVLELGSKEVAPSDEYSRQMWELARKVVLRDMRSGWELFLNPKRLKIMTIDALCTYLAGQLPILSRFGAQPQQAEEVDDLYMQAIDNLLYGKQIVHEWQEQINVLLLHLDNDHRKIKTLLLYMLKTREQWLPTIGEVHKDAAPLRQQLEAALQTARAEWLDEIMQHVPQVLDFTLLQLQVPMSVEDWLIVADLLLTQNDEWRKTFTAKQGFFPASAAQNRQERAELTERKQAGHKMLEQLQECEQFRQLLAVVRKLPAPTYDEYQWNVIAALSHMLVLLVANLLVVFKDAGVVDFTQVSLAAQMVVGSEDNAALQVNAQIRHILIDEFQDTSIGQYELLRYLTRDWSDGDGRTLFVVGDPMQSIYRFRQAEVGLFLYLKEHGLNDIRLKFVQLLVNFRSDQAIITWCNRICAQIFPAYDDVTLGAIKYTPAVGVREAQVAQQPAVTCNVTTEGLQAYAIIDMIKNIRMRNPNYSIAILVRAKHHIQELLPLLRQFDIEYNAVDFERLDERQVVQDLLSLTRAILHRGDRIAWLAILRAPWCGLDLIALEMLAGFSGTIWDALECQELRHRFTAEQVMRVKAVHMVLHNCFNVLHNLTIDQLVKYAWQELGGAACLQHVDQELEVIAYLDLLAKFAHSNSLLAPGFLELELAKLTLPGSSTVANAVQIMTIHKAKGLEFDAVIMPGLHRQNRRNEHKLLLLERRDFVQDYLLLAPIKAAHTSADKTYSYLAWCAQQRQALEDCRLFYVAATRAKHELYCIAEMSADKPAAGSLLNILWPILQAEFAVVNKHSAVSIQQNDNSLRRLPLVWYQQHQVMELHKQGAQIAYMPLQDDWVRVAGILLHKVLAEIAQLGVEACNLSAMSAHDLRWREFLRAQGMREANLAQATGLVYQAVLNACQDEFGQRILVNPTEDCRTEWRLSFVDGREFANVVIDRLFVPHAQEAWIVDYKLVLSATDIPLAVSKYRQQLRKYEYAVKSLDKYEKIITGLYFPLQQEWVPV